MNVINVTDVTNHEQVTRHLLEAKANIEAQSAKGNTSLIFASQKGHTDVRRLLIGDFIHHQSN